MTPRPARGNTSRRLAVLISGGGRTLLNLIDRIDRGELDAEIVLVIASADCPGAHKAKALGLSVLTIPGVIPAPTLRRVLQDHSADLVALAGYLKLVEIPEGWQNRILNIHPALLPAHGGKGMHGLKVHQAVLDAGDRVSGCTVHVCDAAYDRGPILAQRSCEVLPGDTAETLAARVFALECELYPSIIARVLDGGLSIEGADTRKMEG